MMPQSTAIKPAVKPAETKTCATCPNFNNHNFHHELDNRNGGWCEQFNQYVRANWEKTNDCTLNSETDTADTEINLDDIFANYSLEEQEALREEAFPTKIVWVDDRGYPMGEQTVANGYFSTDFVTYPNEPF